jgi:hypothetical protein
MASRIITQLISDLSGKEINDGKGETVDFAYRGSAYTIDVTADEAAAFDETLAPYIERATKKGNARRATRSAARSDAKAVRAWAKDRGLAIPDRGRIPADIRAQFEAAH